MLKNIIIILIFSSAVFIKANGNFIQDTSSAGDCLFHWADCNDITEPDSSSFILLNKHFVFMPDGSFKITDSSGIQNNLKLQLEKYFYILKMRYALCNNKIILVYEVSDYDVGSGEILQMDLQGKIEWRVHIPGFNTGFPVIADNFIYLSCIGWVGKLDLTSHKYVWQTEDLYQQSGSYYNSFEKPYLKDNKVFFPESVGWYLHREPLLLVIDNNTGKILSGIVKKKGK